MAHVLGIDFGGTKILAGVVDVETGKVLSSAKRRTRALEGNGNPLDRLIDVADDAIQQSGADPAKIRHIGIGVAGQVDVEKGELVKAPNLPNELLGRVIAETVCDHLKHPVRMFNDVAVAAAGEAAFGAGKGHPDFVCIWVGTGIGGAIYQAGKPYRGATGTAGELGHIVIEHEGRMCGCGGRGHLEAYASRTAIVRTILGAMRLGRETVLSEVDPNPNPDDPAHSPIRSKAIAAAIAAGDELTISMVDNGARYLSAGLISIINFYNPPLIILGGGVIDAVDRLFERAVDLAKNEALLVPRSLVTIAKAQLGDYSGIVGAAVLASR